MKKIILAAVLLLAMPLFAANTVTHRDGSTLITMGQIATSGANSTDAFSLGPYQSGSVQCVWANVTGTQPSYKLQVSNNNTNWDDVSGATTTTTGGSGSGTWIIDPMVSRYARVTIGTTSTAGTLDCIAILKKY